MLVAGLAATAGLVATSPAHADPSFPCITRELYKILTYPKTQTTSTKYLTEAA
jgi:hypothetical protein